MRRVLGMSGVRLLVLLLLLLLMMVMLLLLRVVVRMVGVHRWYRGCGARVR